ncbi:MAG TPA: DUF1097 domain-containing protein [Aestuariivirgaceae bacterium]|jgi:Protein of unknown function (DUF1097)|nr:DUF1097 domain-containing protein [Aestuariivirgaceae bacterium]
MNLNTALAIVIGVLGAVATWLYVGPLAAFGLQIWATFIAWACFYHTGGGEAGLKNTIAANIWGAICATVALVLVAKMGGGAMGAGLWVGLTVAVMILGAQVPLLSSIPAAVYGYAAVAAYGLMKGGDAMDFGLGTGPFTTVVVSMVVGAVLGYVSQKIATAITDGARARA